MDFFAEEDNSQILNQEVENNLSDKEEGLDLNSLKVTLSDGEKEKILRKEEHNLSNLLFALGANSDEEKQIQILKYMRELLIDKVLVCISLQSPAKLFTFRMEGNTKNIFSELTDEKIEFAARESLKFLRGEKIDTPQ